MGNLTLMLINISHSFLAHSVDIFLINFQYPMAVVGTAGRGIIIYTLEGQPKEYKRVDPPLKYQHRCISIFRDKKSQPTGKLPMQYYYQQRGKTTESE